MRILELSWEYPPHVVGGIGSHVRALAPSLAALGNSVDLVTPLMGGGAASECENGLSVHRVETAPWLDDLLRDVQRTNERLEAYVTQLVGQGEPFDIIHAHDWLVSFCAIALKEQFRVPLLATIHATERGRWRGYLGGDLSQQIGDAEWRLTFEAWRVITPSHYMAGELEGYFSLPSDKVDVVPNGIDAGPFDALDGVDLSAFRAQYAQPKEPIVFNIGRLAHEKGTHLLLEAVPHVLSEHPAARFVIAGTGPMADGLVARARALNVGDNVIFAGRVSDEERDRLFKVANCAVFPSLYEPFGIVALEAMAARCPLVVAGTGGLAEVVQHQVTGETVSPDSVDSLAAGILETLNHPDGARARARAAYEWVVGSHNWREIAQQTLQVMQRVVDERMKVAW